MASKTVDYAAQVKALDMAEKERLLSRMSGKLPKRLAKDKLTEEEALAIQLELEDEQLEEWKEKVALIRAKEEKKKNK
jgi:hypothetical protein